MCRESQRDVTSDYKDVLRLKEICMIIFVSEKYHEKDSRSVKKASRDRRNRSLKLFARARGNDYSAMISHTGTFVHLYLEKLAMREIALSILKISRFACRRIARTLKRSLLPSDNRGIFSGILIIPRSRNRAISIARQTAGRKEIKSARQRSREIIKTLILSRESETLVRLARIDPIAPARERNRERGHRLSRHIRLRAPSLMGNA